MKDDHSQLVERVKELECLYQVDELLHNKDLSLAAAMRALADTIPDGFANPYACRIQISLWDDKYAANDFSRAEILYRSPIVVMEEPMGEIAMGYIAELLDEKYGILDSEIKMLDTIARLISRLAFSTRRELSQMVEMLRTVDPNMLPRIVEKLRVYLKKNFSAEGDNLFSEIDLATQQTYGEVNSPMARPVAADMDAQLKKIIARATDFLPQGKVRELFGDWIHEERVLAIIKVVDNKDARVSEILEAVRKFTEAEGNNAEKSTTDRWLVSVLAHRFLTNDENIINLILDNIKISDFVTVLERNIGAHNSRGSIGGKGAGLFIAQQILQHAATEDPLLREIRTPRTWYLATDQIVEFFNYNNLEELNSYKYNSLYHLRLTYDNLVSKIMNAKLPPRTIQMLHLVLEDMEDAPLVIRSSALLEDGLGIAFSGKYKSLFVSNQGTRKERLEALVTAILEVYSSMFNPDAIQYRRERGLLNFSEEMGVLIQEVVGTKVGKYYMPAFAGVAFSHNQLRWSARINRDDGLVRMVMGLGTRAVDRVTDDYPLLFSLVHPELSVNRTPAEIRHYSPKYIDLINLEDKRFETVAASKFLRQEGALLPDLHKYVSVYNENFIENKNAFSLDTKNDDMIITFNHILTATDIPKKLEHIITALSTKMNAPVEIEFACDGEHVYLLQCRFQGSKMNVAPAPIPQNLKRQDIIFTANQFVSNGLVNGITHVVYVDGKRYDSLSTLEELYAVGEAVGLLGGLLPRHKYILIGPGRWGSRGDIKLGVRVTYSDISNTAALIEIAEKKHSYSPEPSFGTHFFQDLVEAGIVYLPLYPGEKDVIFKESFFRGGDNLLGTLLPQFAHLSDVVKVIDVPASFFRRTLSLHMNSDLEQAVAFLTDQEPASKADPDKKSATSPLWVAKDDQDHWQWRHFMAEQIAESMDMETFGVKGIYLFGSTNSGEARMGSDIDLLLHIGPQNSSQQQSLKDYLDGWSRALARVNYLQTGYKIDKLLDVHIVSDEDIAAGDSFAIKISSTVDPATPLRVLQAD